MTRGQWRYYRSGSGAIRPNLPVRLGRWRWPAVGLIVLLVIAVSLVLPTSVLVYWLVRGVSAGEPLLILWEAARNSVFVSGFGCRGIGGGRSAHRRFVSPPRRDVQQPPRTCRIRGIRVAGHPHRPGLRVLLRQLCATAVPDHRASGVWGTWCCFVSAAVGSIRASLLQVSPNLENSARGLGRTSLPESSRRLHCHWSGPASCRRRPLVFLLTMKELPATLDPEPHRVSDPCHVYLVGCLGSLLSPKRQRRPCC